jgi:hypothetical protein
MFRVMNPTGSVVAVFCAAAGRQRAAAERANAVAKESGLDAEFIKWCISGEL